MLVMLVGVRLPLCQIDTFNIPDTCGPEKAAEFHAICHTNGLRSECGAANALHNSGLPSYEMTKRMVNICIIPHPLGTQEMYATILTALFEGLLVANI